MVFCFSTWYFLPSNTSCLLKKSSEVRKHPLSMLNWSDWNYQVGLTKKDRLNPKKSQTIGKNPKRKVSRCKDSQHKRPIARVCHLVVVVCASPRLLTFLLWCCLSQNLLLLIFYKKKQSNKSDNSFNKHGWSKGTWINKALVDSWRFSGMIWHDWTVWEAVRQWCHHIEWLLWNYFQGLIEPYRWQVSLGSE